MSLCRGNAVLLLLGSFAAVATAAPVRQEWGRCVFADLLSL